MRSMRIHPLVHALTRQFSADVRPTRRAYERITVGLTSLSGAVVAIANDRLH
jgi:hypothetical protein